MTDRNKDGDYPAFPVTAGHEVYANGLTLRDWFAGQALAGFQFQGDVIPSEARFSAYSAYRIADFMLQARKG